MFLELAQTKKPVFEASKKFTLEGYRVTRDFPSETKEDLQPLGHHLVSVFKLLTGLIG